MSDALKVLAWAFAWSTLYFILCLWNPKRSYEWHIRTVTVTHATLVSALGVYSIFVLGPWPFDHSGGPSTPFQHNVVGCSLGYFLLDLSWCLYFNTEGPVMLLHHSVSIVGLSVCYIMKYYGTELVATIAGAELTNPLLQTRWFLRETKNHRNTLGLVVDVSFMFLFGFIRIGVGTVLLVRYYQQDTDFLGRLGGTIIYSIGWLFWISIVQYGFKKWRKIFSNKGDHSKTIKAEGESEIKLESDKTEVNGNLKNGNHMHLDEHKNGVDLRQRNGFKKDLQGSEQAVH